MKMQLALVAAAGLTLSFSATADDEKYLGQLSKNPYAPNSTSNPYAAGSRHDADSINNPYGQYGSRYSNKSANNPYATDAPKLYDAEGNYRGKLSSNKYDPESISNPYGRYGNPHSPESVNNPYGAGNRYRNDSPTNPYGTGLSVLGQGDDSAKHEAPSTSPYAAPPTTSFKVPSYSAPSYSAPRATPYTQPNRYSQPNPYSQRDAYGQDLNRYEPPQRESGVYDYNSWDNDE